LAPDFGTATGVVSSSNRSLGAHSRAVHNAARVSSLTWEGCLVSSAEIDAEDSSRPARSASSRRSAAARALAEDIAMTTTPLVLTPVSEAPTATRRRTRRVRPLVAAIVAVLAVGVSTAAATAIVKARTGRQAEPAGETRTGGEWIRLDAPDAPEVLAELARPIPLPPGTDVGEFVSHFLADQPTEATDEGLQGLFAFRAAACEWPRYWLDARARGDLDAQADAQAVLDGAPEWTWITAGDGGSVADALRHLADDLRSGDTESAQQTLAANC
jgi:hypothetical protein